MPYMCPVLSALFLFCSVLFSGVVWSYRSAQ